MDAEIPFWTSVVAFSEYTGTPVVNMSGGMSLTTKGLLEMALNFQKHCLDDGGAFSDGKMNVNVDAIRPRILREIGAEDSSKRQEAFLALTFFDLVRETLNEVIFFVTEDGFARLAPPTQLFNNDLIVMIKGAPIPFILRPIPVTKSYLLVGSCYVSGLMDSAPGENTTRCGSFSNFLYELSFVTRG